MSPDITMCSNRRCPSKRECYRAIAKPSRYQSMTEFQFDKVTKKCEHFWPQEGEQDAITTTEQQADSTERETRFRKDHCVL